MDIAVRKYIRCRVSVLLRSSKFSAFDPISYPVDIAQGTAIPRWAYDNVMVSDVFIAL